jgi:N6-adenosine-specific RNA methylase IME4
MKLQRSDVNAKQNKVRGGPASNTRQATGAVGAVPRKYKIIYADPPWKYDNEMSGNPAWGGKTYPTMPLQQIKDLPVGEIADKDCALFLWAVFPKLKEALEVINAWGFKYITCTFTWVKTNKKKPGIYSGMGRWTNGNAELCLFAKRRRPRRVAKNVKQIIIAPVGSHSAKPAEVRERIVRLMGDLPRIELFARQRVEGWDAWGNEVESTIQLKTWLPSQAGSPIGSMPSLETALTPQTPGLDGPNEHNGPGNLTGYTGPGNSIGHAGPQPPASCHPSSS